MKRIKAYFQEIATIHSSPHQIATGFATGTLIGILPTPGFSVLLAVFVVFMYPKISKLSLIGALALFNPLFMIPFYYASYQLGTFLFPSATEIAIETSFLNTAFQFTKNYLIGNVLIATTTAVLSYGIIYWVASLYHRKKAKLQRSP